MNLYSLVSFFTPFFYTQWIVLAQISSLKFEYCSMCGQWLLLSRSNSGLAEGEKKGLMTVLETEVEQIN